VVGSVAASGDESRDGLDAVVRFALGWVVEESDEASPVMINDYPPSQTVKLHHRSELPRIVGHKHRDNVETRKAVDDNIDIERIIDECEHCYLCW
jgi:hypothetical protein